MQMGTIELTTLTVYKRKRSNNSQNRGALRKNHISIIF